ncbi:YncE family protein [Alcaligenes phenolicus]|uniref:YncE family protein n=1 Tax=Alcaligenes phenolicus TaxID=232846 RepID=UPI0009F1BEC8|nr:YncE family protein [Alcaligenes phenolicus]OQV31510.1 hypothetical protein BV899_11560 [Alcaligenes phenolicus]
MIASRPASLKMIVASVMGALLLSACQTAPQSQQAGQTSSFNATAPQAQVTFRQDTIDGAYEILAAKDSKQLFVAATPLFEDRAAGFLHVLDQDTLRESQLIQLPRRAFALGLNQKTHTLYVGNTLDGSLLAINSLNGTVKQLIQLGQKEDKGGWEHTRKVVIDEQDNRIFVTNPSEGGRVWIVDGADGRILHNIDNVGLWPAGAAYDANTKRLFVGHGGKDEIAVINPATGAIEQRFTTGDAKSDKREDSRHFFVNIALSADGKKLFGADANIGKIYQFDTSSGKVENTAEVGLGLLDIVYNDARKELIATNRGVDRETPAGTGSVTILDANTLAVKHRISAPVHPNSVTLSADGQTAFVTIKIPHGDKSPHYLKGAKDSVLRLNLNQL